MTMPNAVRTRSSVECIRTEAGLEALGAEWSELFHRAGCEHVFLAHEWLCEWWKQWGIAGRMRVYTLRAAEGRLLGVAPLYIRTSRGVRVLAFIGSANVASDHMNILVEPGYEDAAARSFVQSVIGSRSDWDYIELADADAGSPVFDRLRCEFRRSGMAELTVRRPPRPYALLTPSFDDYLATLAHRVRKNFRRALRSMEASGDVRLLCLTENAEITSHFHDLLQLHAERFRQLEKASSFLAPAVLAFHAGVLSRMQSRTWPRLYLLKVGRQVVSALYGFSIGSRFSFYQSGVDPAWLKHSVGLVMIGCCIRHATETGHREFDFLRGTPPYKLHWAKESRSALTVRLFDKRFRSLCARLLFSLRAQASRTKQSLTRVLKRMPIFEKAFAKT